MRLRQDLRVALVHYWYVRRRGGERVFEVLADMFPQADLFTMVLDKNSLPHNLQTRNFKTSFLQRLPGIKRHYPKMMALYPLALEQLRLDDYDLVISHESGPAKGVLTRSNTCHICYSHSPMRYVWEMYHRYYANAPGGALGKAFYALSSHYLRQWDLASASRVDHFATSSRNGAARIEKFYRRQAQVIYPPVDVSSFTVGSATEDFYLIVSPLVTYKRVDLAIAACNALKRRLIIIGQGEESDRLRDLAGPTVSFLGFQPDAVVADYYQRCRAFLFPGEEDIGLTPIEAQASGRPVIAFAKGGALETVNGFFPDEEISSESSGVFFAEPSSASLQEAILTFEANEPKFSRESIRASAQRFDIAHFKRSMHNYIEEKYTEFNSRSSGSRKLDLEPVGIAELMR